MTIDEHIAAIKSALEAARQDGYLVEGVFFYASWWGEREVSSFEMGLYRCERGADGIMRVKERGMFLEGDV